MTGANLDPATFAISSTFSDGYRGLWWGQSSAPNHTEYRFAKGAGSEMPPTSMCSENRALMSAVNDLGTANHPIERSADYDERVLVEAELLDVGDQALIRGFDAAFPILRPGLFLSYCGRRSCRPQSANGSSPTVVPPPPMRER